jgi:hypothetical protein
MSSAININQLEETSSILRIACCHSNDCVKRDKKEEKIQ